MNDKIRRSVHYYELLAKKYSADGFSENQARVYDELAALVGECADLEEIQERMRERGYLEKPGQALYLDKLAAHIRAADENGFPDLASIYRKKFEEVQNDPGAAYIPGWEEAASAELNRIGNIVGALNEIFAACLRYRGTHPADAAHGKAAEAIRAGAAEIHANGASFAIVVDLPYFRRHSPLDDARYARARDEILSILNDAADTKAHSESGEQEITERTQNALGILEKRTDDLKKVGREFDERSGRAVWLSIAPETGPGPYTREVFYSE